MQRHTLIGAAAGFAFCLWIGWAAQGLVLSFFGQSWMPERLGVWGDSFGALNSLFAGGAAVGVVATLLLQSQSISEQKREQKRERFEAHFFQLLSLVREIRLEIKASISRNSSGPDAIADYANEMYAALMSGQIVVAEPQSSADVYLRRVHRFSEAGLGAYFRVMFNIIRLIDSEPSLSDPEKQMYGNLFRAQLGSNELILIGFNALTQRSKKSAERPDNMFEYVKKYRLLRYTPDGEIRSLFYLHYGDAAMSERPD